MAEQSKQQLEQLNQDNFPNNNTNFITPDKLRQFNTAVIDSTVNQTAYDINSGSWNATDASLQGQINALVLSGSGVQIQDDGTAEGTATTLNFNGGLTANVAAGKADIRLNGSTVTTSSFNSFSSSVANEINTLENDIAELDLATGSLLSTSSFNAYTESNDSRVQSLETETGSLQSQIDSLSGATGSFVTTSSFNDFSSSVATEINDIQAATGSFATTSSLNELSASLEARITTDETNLDNLSSSLESRLTTDENQILANALNIELLSDKTGSYATTGSNTFVGNQNIAGDVSITGTLTATEIHTQYETSSIIYASGSTKFGDTQDDTHEFTGSVTISGSLTSLDVTAQLTASWAENAITASYVDNAGTSSYAQYADNTIVYGKNISGGTYSKRNTSLLYG